MNSLKIVFSTVKEHCNNAGVANEKCSEALEQLVTDRQLLFPLYFYMSILRDLGLLVHHDDHIVLTAKGKAASLDSLIGLHTTVVFLLEFLQLAFFFLLLWPMFLGQKMHHGSKENSEYE